MLDLDGSDLKSAKGFIVTARENRKIGNFRYNQKVWNPLSGSNGG